MNEPKPIKITIERDIDDKLELVVSPGLTLRQDATSAESSWEETFRIILTWLAFPRESVDNLFGSGEWGEELEEEEAEN